MNLSALKLGLSAFGVSTGAGLTAANLPWTVLRSTGGDQTAAIQAALDGGRKGVVLPDDNYVVSSATITVPKGVSLLGNGKTVLDASGAAFASLTNGRVLQTARGTLTALPALASNVSRGGRSLAFSSAPTVAIGDVLVVYNATDGSWLSDRTYYRAGEYVRVAKVSGSTVTLIGALCDSYLSSAVSVYRLDDATTCELSGFTVKCPTDHVNQIYGVVVNHAVDSIVRGVRSIGASYMGLAVWDCYNVAVEDCVALEDMSSDFGGDYGLAVVNSQHVTVRGGQFCSARHGVVVTGSGSTGDVPNRFVTIGNGAHIATTAAGGINAANVHGCSEHVSFDGAVIDGGVIMAGDRGRVVDCTIRCSGLVGVYFTELKGFNHDVVGNTIVSDGTSDSARGLFVDCGGNGGGLTTTATRGGTMTVASNRLELEMTTQGDTLYPMRFANNGYTGSQMLRLVVRGNTMNVSDASARVGYSSVVAATTKAFDYVGFLDNEMVGCAGLYMVKSAGSHSAYVVDVNGNSFDYSGKRGSVIIDVRDSISYRNNVVRRMKGLAAWLGGNASVKCNSVHVSGNSCWNNNLMREGDSTTDVTYKFENITNVIVHDNASDSRNEYLSVTSNTNFTVGETITGGTSGATAVVKGKLGSTEIHIETSRTGTFSAETITGGTSGATTSVSATSFTETGHMSFTSVTNSWMSGNVQLRSLSNSGAASSANVIS